jgi:hypothetical protein
MLTNLSSDFIDITKTITQIGYDAHVERLLFLAELNKPNYQQTLKDLPKLNGTKKQKSVVVSAGPSLQTSQALSKLAASNFDGTVVAVDGSYVKCLKAGIIPDYVLTLDPHPTRIVRWFGDPNFEEHSKHDDYFARQDLNKDFRLESVEANQENIELVNQYASQTKLIISCSAPETVVERTRQAGFKHYWWMPLVDNPQERTSVARKLRKVSGLPAMNTGGNVGTAAWIFSRCWLDIEQTAVVGMDLGYSVETPYNETQTYYELQDKLGHSFDEKDYFPVIEGPDGNRNWYTDPTYFWYRRNILELLATNEMHLYNCTEGGTLHGPFVEQLPLNDFLRR